MKKYKNIILCGAIAIAFLSSCSKPIAFYEDFNNINDRVWVSSDLWTVPIENWQVKNGRLECTGTRPNMRTTLLTYQIADHGELSLTLKMGVLQKGDIVGSGGLIVGLQDDTDNDIKSLVYFGTGVNAGIDTEGNMFLGEQYQTLPDGFNLESFTLNFNSVRDQSAIVLQLQVTDQNGLESPLLEKRDLESFQGAIALINNHRTAKKYAGNNRFWFDDLDISGSALREDPQASFGPILWSMYTLNKGELKLSAQMPPLGALDNNKVLLEVKREGSWEEMGKAAIEMDSRTALFRVNDWDSSQDHPYRLVYEEKNKDGSVVKHLREGTIRRDPVDKPLVLGALTCQYNYGFPYRPLVENLTESNPDMLYFSGDQIYEGNGGYSIIRHPADSAILNYLGKWYMFGWVFGDVMKDRPTVCTPDDHDVFQGNLWGQNAESIPVDEFRTFGGTTGGYVEPAQMVNAVHRTQCGHLPDPPNPEPRAQGITVYHTDIVYGRISFAIVSDRDFKTGPYSLAFWEGRKDWFQQGTDDYSIIDPPGYAMLGDRQLEFLYEWSRDWEGADMKCLLSQTTYTNVATHHGGNKMVLRADLDSGGWPRTARNKILEILRSCFAFHISGDQHLPSIVNYGIDQYQDGSWGFCTPAITVGYQRRFQPERLGWEITDRPDHGLPNTGKYLDGFGNPSYVYAIGNPVDDPNDPNRYRKAENCSSGYALVHFDQINRKYTAEAFHFFADLGLADPTINQFPGWPLTLSQSDNNGLERKYFLPEVTSEWDNPVLEVINEENGELLYSIRTTGKNLKPWVNKKGLYTVVLKNPETGEEKTLTGLNQE